MGRTRVATASKSKRKTVSRVSDLVSIPPKPYPSTNVEHDDITDLDDYLPGASTVEIVERFSEGLRGGKSGRMISITGPYGSGKSTMAIFLKGLVATSKSAEYKRSLKILRRHSASAASALIYARRKAEAHDKGVIRCLVTARREPISVTIARALHRGAEERFKKYAKKFEGADLLQRVLSDLKKGRTPEPSDIIRIVAGICKASPVLIMIDEFGKNIDHFAADDAKEGDLFLLQELAEMSRHGKGVQLSIMTLQHMAFEEYAVGTSAAHKKEWAKIQGRFEDIYFANSADQTRQLVSKTIQRKGGNSEKRKVRVWADYEVDAMKTLGIDSGFDADLIASCYPLSSLALEVLPELCARYGQHERTLLSFLSDHGSGTVSTFIAESTYNGYILPSISLDMLYDYFVAGTSMIHSSSASISRLMEIETIIRDSHGLDDEEAKVLKTIGVLNLVGQSGYLRASRGLLDHVMGGDAGDAIKSLEEKSIIVYRRYADEYRIWHGTDIDIAAKLDAHRKRYKGAQLATMLEESIDLVDAIAARHGRMTGTMRIFRKRFATGNTERNVSYDGIIVYDPDGTAKDTLKHDGSRPVITVTTEYIADLRREAIEVTAIRDMLENDEDVGGDRVARKELGERLADARVRLEREFGRAFGKSARWYYYIGDRQIPGRGDPTSQLSKICDKVYNKAPHIHNEMINKSFPSSQGMSAKRRVLEAMFSSPCKMRFGLEGNGPDRAVYKAVIQENDIHVEENLEWEMRDPTGGARPAWDAILGMLKDAKERVPLSEIYQICRMPPYGIKDGVIDILVNAVLFVHKDSIAVYEHGTYVPRMTIEVVERMMKNIEFFDAKYFKPTPSRRKLLDEVATALGTESKGSVISIVSHLVQHLRPLPAYTKNTKNVSESTQAVRRAILEDTEPDTMLFKSLPEAVGMKAMGDRIKDADIRQFARRLAEAVKELQNEMPRTLEEIKAQLLRGTVMKNRRDLSRAAAAMEPTVSDRSMKVFLTALGTDALEKDMDWMNYVVMSIAETTPDEWTDNQRATFNSLLDDMTARFRNLAALRFAKVSKNLKQPSFQVTVTRSDGSERRSLVLSDPKKVKKLKAASAGVIKELKRQGLSKKDVDSLIALLCEEAGLVPQPAQTNKTRDQAGGGKT